MDRAELVAQMAAGHRPKFWFFWGHTPARPIGKQCFSQWFSAPFEIDGIRYATAEHYMMAEKARVFDDREALEQILAAGSPAKAKALGRGVRRYDDKVWSAARYDAVVVGNRAKFGQDAELREFLCNTKKRVLVEASPVDRVWGIGLAHDHQDAGRPNRWRGDNLLGFALMQVRDELLAQ